MSIPDLPQDAAPPSPDLSWLVWLAAALVVLCMTLGCLDVLYRQPRRRAELEGAGYRSPAGRCLDCGTSRPRHHQGCPASGSIPQPLVEPHLEGYTAQERAELAQIRTAVSRSRSRLLPALTRRTPR